MTTATKTENTPKQVTAISAPVYGVDGTEAGNISLPGEVFALPWNADLVHQVVVSMQSNARSGTAHTKDRSEVSGGGKKPWRQKGTGRARHGSSRSPIWRGGGVTFGPRNEKDYSRKISKKMRTKALFTVLSQKLRDGEIYFVESFGISEIKTKDGALLLGNVAKGAGIPKLVTKAKNAGLLAIPEAAIETKKSFRNIPNVSVAEIRNLNPVEILAHTYLIIENPKEALKILEARNV